MDLEIGLIGMEYSNTISWFISYPVCLYPGFHFTSTTTWVICNKFKGTTLSTAQETPQNNRTTRSLCLFRYIIYTRKTNWFRFPYFHLSTHLSLIHANSGIIMQWNMLIVFDLLICYETLIKMHCFSGT